LPQLLQLQPIIKLFLGHIGYTVNQIISRFDLRVRARNPGSSLQFREAIAIILGNIAYNGQILNLQTGDSACTSAGFGFSVLDVAINSSGSDNIPANVNPRFFLAVADETTGVKLFPLTIDMLDS